MTQVNRLAGGLIDRTRTLNFSFDGKAYQGHGGDTLASALLANGVRLMGRSFKYHRPRGPLTAGSEEPNALVELRRGSRQEPNTRATVAELFDGLEAQGHNLYKETKSSGSPELGNPTENGFGELQQGFLELSNVSVVQEMVNLILAQRAYEVNSKAVQAADEMMQQSNNLQR